MFFPKIVQTVSTAMGLTLKLRCNNQASTEVSMICWGQARNPYLLTVGISDVECMECRLLVIMTAFILNTII